ncbi:unnamed protein product [Heligmosomoides polygyrus]|uniref:Uncharacterized protein n=1 Tax=Heligmosomoides polygyrus TaxID=6339 RepID=A0A183F9A8_HELPZ|nr:unnamed protein product [Heligmosomoides polygyrus]
MDKLNERRRLQSNCLEDELVMNKPRGTEVLNGAGEVAKAECDQRERSDQAVPLERMQLCEWCESRVSPEKSLW